MPNVQIEDSWKFALVDEFEKEYFSGIRTFLRTELKEGKTIFPPGKQIFNAFNLTPFNDVKVVVIGQDPYHGPNQAMGLSFSVPIGVRVPASLRNIYKELNDDVEFNIPDHGDLTRWAKQGVFLLNAMLTVEKAKPGSHKKIGWQEFTNAVIKKLSERREGLVFLLWGRFAQQKEELIDGSKHVILKSPHPSPLARGGFFGNHHFSKTNQALIKQGKAPINWQL